MQERKHVFCILAKHFFVINLKINQPYINIYIYRDPMKWIYTGHCCSMEEDCIPVLLHKQFWPKDSQAQHILKEKQCKHALHSSNNLFIGINKGGSSILFKQYASMHLSGAGKGWDHQILFSTSGWDHIVSYLSNHVWNCTQNINSISCASTQVCSITQPNT